MGYQDRDYRKEFLEPPNYINVPKFPVVYWLIILCVLLSLIETDNKVRILTDISFTSILKEGHIWAIFMAPFSPDFFWPALFHCLAIFFIGRRFIETDGIAEFLSLYFISSLVGMVFFWSIQYFSPNHDSIAAISPDAATWSLCGIAMCYAVRYPSEKVLLYFVLPIQIKLLMTAVVVIVLLKMSTSRSPIAEYMALLGALGFGFLYSFYRIRLTSINSQLKRLFGKASLPVLGGSNQMDQMSQEEIKKEVDRILDKITEKGAISLTTKERDFLMKSSKRFH